MSETPIYFVLAQLNSLMTGTLRLSLAFLALSLMSAFVSLHWQKWLPLTRYFSAFAAVSACVGVVAAGAEKWLLPYENPFVNQGLITAGIYLISSALLCLLQGAKLFKDFFGRLIVSVLGCAVLGLSFYLPSFSRSDKLLFATLMIWPMAVGLAYFPALLAGRQQPLADLKKCFHLLWIPGAVCALGLHYFWLYPFLAAIPKEGEFYPFINLYDWFLFMAMILYLGNLYVDYWLRQGSQQSRLALSWNYLVAVVAVLCVWLNANIFDTLAL